MKAKNIMSLTLLVFVGASVLYLVFDERNRTGGTVETGEEQLSMNAGNSPPPDSLQRGIGVDYKVTAYYFYGTKRCKTCLAIESYTKESLEAGFPDELRSGVLEWRPINVDEPRNEHFVEEYELSTNAVVLAAEHGGERTEWKKLGEVWDLVGDKQSFLEYVRRETEQFLGG